MFEKVNPSHPDKVADRIAGALVDMAYAKQENPKIAVEVLIGHGACHIIAETSVELDPKQVDAAVQRISGEKIKVDLVQVPQDAHLANNQNGKIRCGDNGIFKGEFITSEQSILTARAKEIYEKWPSDGKYILDVLKDRFIICQSNAKNKDLKEKYGYAEINPLGEWTGGTSVDSGATNRKLGSDMGDGVTGGGLHGKDLSKADVSINIYAFLKAEMEHSMVEISCAIGDEKVDGRPYSEIVKIARDYINSLGGFEKFAEWGLIRP